MPNRLSNFIKDISKKWFSLILFLFLMCLFSDIALNWNQNAIGYDFAYFIPRLLEGVTFFKVSGLSIPWYSAKFCGGSPFFPNPQSMFYSLPQALTLIMNVWSAIRVTLLLSICSASFGAYLLARQPFKLPHNAALITAILFASSGFFLNHFAVGHLSYHSFVLIPWICWAILDTHLKFSKSIVLIGILGAYFVHSGGYYTTFICALSVPGIIGLFFLKETQGRISFLCLEFLKRMIFGGTIALGLAASKIAAVKAFVQNFTRPVAFDQSDSISSLFSQIFEQLFLVRTTKSHGYEPWEFNNLMSPLCIVGLFSLALVLLKSPSIRFKFIVRSRLFGSLIFTLWLIMSLSIIGGSQTAEHLISSLGLGSLRVNMRFTSVFSLPISLLAGMGVMNWRAPRQREFLNIVALTSPIFAMVPLALLNFWGALDISSLREFDQQVRTATPQSLAPKTVAAFEWNDLNLMQNRVTPNICYEPLFMGKQPGQVLKAGQAPTDIDGDRFNLLNPSCLVFPQENNCSTAVERFTINQRTELDAFLSFNEQNWNISPQQSWANLISLISLMLLLPALLFFLYEYFKQFRCRQNG